MCAGLKFRRQAAIGQYIVDFVCYEVKVIVELDGTSQDASALYDADRTKWFEQQAYKVIRFTNEDVRDNLEGVWERIRVLCENRKDPPLPDLSHKGRGIDAGFALPQGERN